MKTLMENHSSKDGARNATAIKHQLNIGEY